MLKLSDEARRKYAELNKLYADEVAKGIRNSFYPDLLNLIHDKYKAIQRYPNIGKEVPHASIKGLRSIPLKHGWSMLYISEDYITVIDFVKEEDHASAPDGSF